MAPKATGFGLVGVMYETSYKIPSILHIKQHGNFEDLIPLVVRQVDPRFGYA
jgi:hypothetical protein